MKALSRKAAERTVADLEHCIVEILSLAITGGAVSRVTKASASRF